MNKEELKTFLDRKVDEYNQPSFILKDPISIPHKFSLLQDKEIAGFFAAIFSWGNRTTIINKSMELMQLMEMQPYAFCMASDPGSLKRLSSFRHRTFTTVDLLYFIEFFKFHYSKNTSLESAFNPSITEKNKTVETALNNFYHYFFSLEHVPNRTQKHIASPAKGSTCKRLNMFLRWMVRNDNKGVDLGLWKELDPSQLICPIDIHVARVARQFGLLSRKQTDWAAAIELTDYLRTLDPRDPVKYDFALFALGVMEKYG